MRKVTITEGRGTVEINKGRAEVRFDGGHLGQVTRRRDGRWIDPATPHLSHAGPEQAAESLIEHVAGVTV